MLNSANSYPDSTQFYFKYNFEGGFEQAEQVFRLDFLNGERQRTLAVTRLTRLHAAPLACASAAAESELRYASWRVARECHSAHVTLVHTPTAALGTVVVGASLAPL